MDLIYNLQKPARVRLPGSLLLLYIYFMSYYFIPVLDKKGLQGKGQVSWDLAVSLCACALKSDSCTCELWREEWLLLLVFYGNRKAFWIFLEEEMWCEM